MSDLPNFSDHGYQVSRILGQNHTGGRVVYLGHNLEDSTQSVVIKQFQFARGDGWSEFKEIDREMQVLKDLKHQGIPHYLGSFQTDDGYCIVQEYKDAPTLAIPRSFDPDEIKQIAIAILEILVYLQSRVPYVIHRDIKPENVLVDEHLNVYLIDFGFARIGGGEVAMSSVAAGTFGFMAPEQMYNKGLTTATDLYGLGAMLISLLTSTKSTKMDALISEDGKIEFKHLTKQLSLRFVDWLDKMVAPKVKDRYATAEIALAEIQSIYVTRYPTIEFSDPVLEFNAIELGEKITRRLTITNITPDTLLQGKLSIEAHPNDRSHSPYGHKWISLSTKEIEGNDVECYITIDTSKLTAQSTGTRRLSLHSNAIPDTNSIELKIITAPLPVQIKQLPYLAMGGLLIFAFACGSTLRIHGFWGNPWAACWAGVLLGGLAIMFTSIAINLQVNRISSVVFRSVIGFSSGWIVGGGLPGAIVGGTFSSGLGFLAGGLGLGIQVILGGFVGILIGVCTSLVIHNSDMLIVEIIIGIQSGTLGVLSDTKYIHLPANNRHQHGFIFIMLLMIGILGVNLGAGLDLQNIFLLSIALIAAIVISFMFIYPQFNSLKQIDAYRKKEKYLITM